VVRLPAFARMMGTSSLHWQCSFRGKRRTRGKQTAQITGTPGLMIGDERASDRSGATHMPRTEALASKSPHIVLKFKDAFLTLLMLSSRLRAIGAMRCVLVRRLI
jgi:hypothetical protein